MAALFTLGYQGAAIDAFFATLTEREVVVLADVRAVPFSRQRAFSKGPLRERCTAAGLRYEHFPSLGNPSVGRAAARAGNAAWQDIYRAHLANAEARGAVEAFAQVAARARTCMVCLEADPAHCHRSILAERLAAYGFVVEHLHVPGAAGQGSLDV